MRVAWLLAVCTHAGDPPLEAVKELTEEARLLSRFLPRLANGLNKELYDPQVCERTSNQFYN